MNLGTPVYNTEGLEIASPRLQGSGLANIEKAINTPAYLYTESESDNFRPKLSLGDNLNEKFGTLAFSVNDFYFHLKNVSDTSQTYTLSSDVFRDDSDEYGLAENVARADADVKFMLGMTEITEITVAPGEDVVINVYMNLSLDEQQYIEDTFENGTFIDGYLNLKSESAPNLVLPFMGFYGSWSDAEIFEPFAYNTSKTSSYMPSIMSDPNYNTAGMNTIASMYDETIFGMPCYSPDGNKVFDNIVLNLGFKRRCYNVKAEIYNNQTKKKVYVEDSIASGNWVLGMLGFITYFPYDINWDFAGVSEGEIYEIKVTAEDPLNGQGGRKEIISQEFIIDITPPVIEEYRKLNINGNEYLQIKVSDNNAVQGAVLLQKNNVNEDTEMIAADYCSDSNSTSCLMTLEMPDISDDCYVEIYDMAGNVITVDASEAKDTYNLTYDENIFFSTNDQTFKNKISLTDSNGNDVSYNVSSTPKNAYNKHISEISIEVDSFEIAVILVVVGLAGDTDLNGKVSLSDVVTTSKYLLWSRTNGLVFKEEFTGFDGTFPACLADYDADGKIDLIDAVEASKLLLPTSKYK